jgi:hypothetical protein
VESAELTRRFVCPHRKGRGLPPAFFWRARHGARRRGRRYPTRCGDGGSGDLSVGVPYTPARVSVSRTAMVSGAIRNLKEAVSKALARRNTKRKEVRCSGVRRPLSSKPENLHATLRRRSARHKREGRAGNLSSSDNNVFFAWHRAYASSHWIRASFFPNVRHTNYGYGSCSFISSVKAVAAKQVIGRPQYRRVNMGVFTAEARPGGNASAVEGVDPVEERQDCYRVLLPH